MIQLPVAFDPSFRRSIEGTSPTARRTHPGKNRVMTGDNEPTPLFSDVASDQRDWHVDVGEVSARGAQHVIVTFHSRVVPTRFIGKSQLLDQPMLSKEVQRPVHRSVRNLRIATTDSLEDFPGSQVPLSRLNFSQDHRPLRGLSECPPPRCCFPVAGTLLIHHPCC